MLIDFCTLNHPWNLQEEFYLVMVYDPFVIYLDLVLVFCCRFLICLSDFCLQFSLSHGVFVWLWYQGSTGIEVFLPLKFFWNDLRRIGTNSSLNTWQNAPVKQSGIGLTFWGFLKLLIPFHYFQLVYLDFLFLGDSVLRDCVFSECIHFF